MQYAINSPLCSFVLNGITGELAKDIYRDPSGQKGPWAYLINKKMDGTRVRGGASCRDIFLSDVLNWADNTSVRGYNQGKPTYAFTILGSFREDVSPGTEWKVISHDQLVEMYTPVISALEVALRRGFKEPGIVVQKHLKDNYFQEEDRRLIVSVTLPKEYWGNLLMASWLAAVVRSWLHVRVDDPNEEIWGFWNQPKYDWTSVPDATRFVQSPAPTERMNLKAFTELVRAVGRTGCPAIRPDLYLNQTTWTHYFQTYFGLTDYGRALGGGYRWYPMGTGQLGCTTVYHNFYGNTGFPMHTHFSRAQVYPIDRFWIGADLELNQGQTPSWLMAVLKEKPAPDAVREAQIAVETTLQSMQMDIATATRVATAKPRAARSRT